MKTMTFFNNKGGVGKTTLTANIAAYFALKLEKRVLVIDCDPQCNITQLILGDEKTINLYWNDGKQNNVDTIKDCVEPILDGDSNIEKPRKMERGKNNRFGVDLIPGHPQLSLLEDPISRAWTELPAGKPGAIRITRWLGSLIETLNADYDYVFIDVSPSLGSLNRSILINCDYFVSPLSADVFSVLGLRNISQWISLWKKYYTAGIEQGVRLNPEAMERFGIDDTVSITSGFVGYTMQQYIAKRKKGVKRPTKAFERIIQTIPDEVHGRLGEFTPRGLNNTRLHLGDVPNMFSLIPLAQGVSAPVFELKTRDGLVGSQYIQVSNYTDIIGQVSKNLYKNLEGQKDV
ncbi:ParA family protein [Alkalicaulis satelles]|uniref:ParA family protein n=1 Tax=Alkalicaulis satelles TaxID=2609175 RepID=A0A5M6ZGJ9_9PROT|nr:ParA family protein [Alkalicaulis satelles]KAA5803882.1 ParA family protein [Alkalicaulis satelles]